MEEEEQGFQFPEAMSVSARASWNVLIDHFKSLPPFTWCFAQEREDCVGPLPLHTAIRRPYEFMSLHVIGRRLASYPSNRAALLDFRILLATGLRRFPDPRQPNRVNVLRCLEEFGAVQGKHPR